MNIGYDAAAVFLFLSCKFLLLFVNFPVWERFPVLNPPSKQCQLNVWIGWWPSRWLGHKLVSLLCNQSMFYTWTWKYCTQVLVELGGLLWQFNEYKIICCWGAPRGQLTHITSFQCNVSRASGETQFAGFKAKLIKTERIRNFSGHLWLFIYLNATNPQHWPSGQACEGCTEVTPCTSGRISTSSRI